MYEEKIKEAKKLIDKGDFAKALKILFDILGVQGERIEKVYKACR